jgi:hypothetical protein
MTRKAGSRSAAKPRPPAPKAPRQFPPEAAAAPRAGRLTKVAAKVNTQVTHIASAKPKPKPKTRRNKKGLVLYVDPAVTVALRRLALDTATSVQALGMTALNLLFAQHGMPPFPVEGDAPASRSN